MSNPVRNATMFGSLTDQGMELLENRTRDIGVYDSRNSRLEAEISIKWQDRFAFNATLLLDIPEHRVYDVLTSSPLSSRPPSQSEESRIVFL